MSGEEDDKEFELKDLIVQTLESNGLLAKIKAQIRASVFTALDENDKKNSHIDLNNSTLKSLIATDEGHLAASLVRDFIEKCNLDYTLSVYDPELNSTMPLTKRGGLMSNLKLSHSNPDVPILIDYIKSSKTPQSEKMADLKDNTIELARSNFLKYEPDKSGLLHKEKIKLLLFDLIPFFSKNVIEEYLTDELENHEKSGINWERFLGLFKKWYNSCQSMVKSINMDVPVKPALKGSILDESLNFNEDSFDPLQPSKVYNQNQNHKTSDEKKKNEEYFFSKPNTNGSLPPLNNNNDSKKMGNFLVKEYEKKLKEEDSYDEDFTSGVTPRSPKKSNKNRVGMHSDEEIDDNLSYVEESSKIDEITIDKSISTLHGNNDADYIEDVSI
jgi:FGFR1 oncogene partner